MKTGETAKLEEKQRRERHFHQIFIHDGRDFHTRWAIPDIDILALVLPGKSQPTRG